MSTGSFQEEYNRLAKNKVDSPSNNAWRYIIGFVIGMLSTLTITILVGWLVNVATPYSSWLNKAFYGYALGCAPTNT